jgi:hypothetical protein
MKTTKKRPSYWKNYERADIKDYRKVWDLTKQIVLEEGVPFERSKRGRPPKLQLWEYVCTSILYVYFNDSFRETEQLLKLLTGKSLDHSNIVRWFGKLNPTYIDKLVYRIHTKITQQSDEGDYIADSTTLTCDRYRERILRGEKVRDHITWKLHTFVQYLSVMGLVSMLSVCSTKGSVNDGPVLRGKLLKKKRVISGRKCHADKAYFGKENIRALKSAKLVPNLVPKEINYSDATLKRAVREYDNEARKKNRGMV